MNIIRRIVAPGQRFPRAYGVAWWNYNTHEAVCYPVPLNHGLAMIRRLWIAYRNYRGRHYIPMEQADNAVLKAYQNGYEAGKAKR